MRFTDTIFHPGDMADELGRKLNALLRKLHERLDVGELRVGDTAKIEHSGDATLADVTCDSVDTASVDTEAFVMATGAGADKLLTSDADGNGTWETAPTTVAGSDTQVQFNDGGALAGDAGMTYDKSTDTLTVGNLSVTSDATVGAEFKGARILYDAAHDGNITASRYLDMNNGAQMSATRGYPLGRPGSIVTVAASAEVLSYTPGATMYPQVYLDGVLAAATTPQAISANQVYTWHATVARDTAGATFSADSIISIRFVITGTATVDKPVVTAEVQFDT